VQATFEETDPPQPTCPEYREASTQLNEDELVPFETRVQPTVEDLVHDVLSRAVFSIEQERHLERIRTQKQKYQALREDEEVKLSRAKQGFLEVSRKNEVQQSVLKKVLSIRIARETVKSVLSSVLHNPIQPLSRLDELIHSLVPEIVDQATAVAEVMQLIGNTFTTVHTRDITIHTNTCVY
jgi:hypothetical protein